MRADVAIRLIVILLLGFVVWRESSDGLLQQAEDRYAAWLATVAGSASEAPEITLVFQSAGEDLTTLDCALFLRAASRLNFPRAGIAALSLRNDDPAVFRNLLEDADRLPRVVVFPSLLNGQSTGEGTRPTQIRGQAGPQLLRFSGYRSPFPPAPSSRNGFVNLTGQAGSVPVVAECGGKLAVSFALAALADPAEMRLEANRLTFSNGLFLDLAPDGTLPLVPDLLRRVNRLELDDLLVEAEKASRDREPKLFGNENRMLLLGTMASDALTGDVRLAEGRKLSLAEFQAAAILSLHRHLQPSPVGWTGLWPGILLAVAVVFVRSLRVVSAFWLLFFCLALYLLASLAAVGSFQIVLPGLPFLAMLLAGVLLPVRVKGEG